MQATVGYFNLMNESMQTVPLKVGCICEHAVHHSTVRTCTLKSIDVQLAVYASCEYLDVQYNSAIEPSIIIIFITLKTNR